MDKFNKSYYTPAPQPKNRQIYGAAKDAVGKVLGFLYDCTYPWRYVLPLTSLGAVLAGIFFATQPGFDGDYLRLALIVLYLAGEWTLYLGSGLAVLTVINLMFRR